MADEQVHAVSVLDFFWPLYGKEEKYLPLRIETI